MLNVKFYRKQKTLNESLQASGQSLLLEGLIDDVLKPLLKKYEDSDIDLKMLQGLGEWPEITPGPARPNVKGLSGPEKAEAFREYNRLRDESKEKNKPKQEEIDRKVKLIKWVNLMYGEGPKDHPPREALPVVQDFLNKLQTMRDKYKSNEDFKEKVDELSSGTSNDPLDINQFTSDDMREIIEAIEVQAGDIVPDKEQARKDKIGETENWEVFMPTTMASSCELGKGTTWCTARTRGDNFFYSYVAKPDSDIVLFYVIKKNAGVPPKEHPKDYLSLGYYEDGKKIERYKYGGVNIDSDNKGVRPEEFASIVGEQEAKEVYRIIEKWFETFTEHPMKEKFREATQDLNVFNSLFTKGMSSELMAGLVESIAKFGDLSPQVQLAVREKILEIIKKRKTIDPWESPSFENLQLPELNLGFGANLSYIDFRGSNFEKSNFENAKLKGVFFNATNLEKCNFTGTKGYQSSFESANLKDAVFLGAELTSTYFVNTKFENANLEGAKLEQADLTKASFKGANLKKVNLDRSILTDTYFSGVNLQGAKLTGTHSYTTEDGPLFLKCDLRGANFSGTRYEVLRLASSDLRASDFIDAVLDESNIQRCKFMGAKIDWNLNECYINLTDFSGAQFKNSFFSVSTIKNSIFERASFEDISFSDIALHEVDFQGAFFRRGRFENVNVEGGNFEGATFKFIKFQNTNLEKANLNGTKFDTCSYYPDTKFPEGFNPEEHGLRPLDKFGRAYRSANIVREYKEFLKDRRLI